jgi:nucleoside-diphosphate-sugar epimerase
MMRVLVTGASGFIGRPLCAALAAAGYPVRAAVRDRRAQDFPSGVETVRLPDLAQEVDWAPLLAGIDAVVHLAAIAHAGAEVADAAYDRVNHLAAAACARAAASAKVQRFVFLSSIGAQSAPSADHSLTEADVARPVKPYGRAKLAAEAAVRAAGLPYTILRPTLVYGPQPKGNIARLLWLASLPLPLPFASLTGPRSLLALDNLIGAIRFALADARAVNETFIVSDPGTVSVAEIVALVRAAAGRRPAVFAAPPRLLGALLALVGQRERWDQLAGALVAEPAKLIAAGWRPAVETRSALAAMVQAASPLKSGTASRNAP